MAAPLVAGHAAVWLLGGAVLLSGALELWQGFFMANDSARRSAFWGGGLSALIGGLLLASPMLVASALALFLGASFIADGMSRLYSAWTSRRQPEAIALDAQGVVNVLLGVLIAVQWPLSGLQVIGLSVGLRILSSGWSMLFTSAPGLRETDQTLVHPDRRLRLPAHPEVARLVAAVQAEEEARRTIDVYWQATFIATFFAIHAGRMSAEWTLVGLASPLVAVAGDIVYAFILALGIVTPVHLGWRALTRSIERRAWARVLAESGPSIGHRVARFAIRHWLLARLRFAVRVHRAYTSPVAALRRGLRIGLPLAAILIAVNPIWGLSWFFNTETWAAGMWERWVEYRVDPWREQMVRAARGRVPAGSAGADRLSVQPPGVAGAADFTFLVIGDPGEGDASQHSLRDQYLALGRRPDVKFLVIMSDVVYPAGAMKDYEACFYLPFKGLGKPIYAMPGNHDWYDALEAFNAVFLTPEAARAAIQARISADYRLTTTTDRRVEALVTEAARLRKEYGVQTGGQRGPYFDLQAERFALIVVDTGVLRTVDADQLQWLRAALERARGKFVMVLLGHPLYVAGSYQGDLTEDFAAIHRLLEEYDVPVVMAGDTHDLEFYRQDYPVGNGQRSMHHFVNGGGGAYLSIGTALAWPGTPPVPDCGYYPRTDALVAKLDRETPAWKQPIWFWVKRLRAWPSTPEFMAGAFDFNRAPFFQSFVEVRVEGSAHRVVLIPHGVNGPLRWRDMQCFGQIIPAHKSLDDPAEFLYPMMSDLPAE